MMLATSRASTWRRFLASSAMASSMGLALLACAGHVSTASAATATAASDAIRPFKIHVPEAQLTDLHKRIAATRWPDRETVSDASQGVQLAQVQALVQYWGNGYDWRKAEAKLNALPEFITTIDGVDIQFLKTIGPLTNPVAYGGKVEDSFDVVIPSIPGHGFSGKPTELGWGPDRVAKAWDVLMKRLGYSHYVSQGGDHGSVISDALGRLGPPGLLGIHLNMPATVPPELVKPIFGGDPAPQGLTDPERKAFNSLSTFFGRNAAYGAMMVTRPQTIGYLLADSPSGTAAWMYEKFAAWTDSDGHPERVLSRDEMLDDISLYWLTNSGASSSRFYWENNNNNFSATAQKTTDIKVPVAITVFPHEIYQAPKTWAQRAYPSLSYYSEVNKGGHFAAWEQPQLFSEELRSAFRPLRGSANATANTTDAKTGQ
jgi:pimeloyl-ACP methyl ester carboxylesterase